MTKVCSLAAGIGVLALLIGASCGGGQTGPSLGAQASPTALPFGTPMPISQGDALWEWIADNSLECEPILRPTYLPSGLSRVSLGYVDQQRGCVLFGVDYWDSAGQARLFIDGGPWFNPPMPGPEAVQEQLNVRQTTGTYQAQDAADPLGQAFLWWQEPGQWGRPGDDWHRDYVEYLISATGFTKEELLKVADGLQPVTQ